MTVWSKLNLDFAPGVSDRTKIADMAIAANPNLRPLGKRATFHSFEPLIVANRIAPYVSVRGSGHFALTNVFQTRRPSARTGDTLFVFQDFFCPEYLCRTARQLERVASWPPSFVAFPYAAILVAAVLSALLFAICVSSLSAFISSCSVWLSSAAASGMPS
jgi:hypothetical protein